MKKIEQLIKDFEEKNDWKFSDQERADILSCINEEPKSIDWYMESLVEKATKEEREKNYMHEAKCFDLACGASNEARLGIY